MLSYTILFFLNFKYSQSVAKNKVFNLNFSWKRFQTQRLNARYMSLLREIKFDFKSNVLYILSSFAIIFYFELKHEFFVTFILFDSVPKGGYKKRQLRQRRSDNQLTEFSRVNDSDPIIGNTTILIVYMIWWKKSVFRFRKLFIRISLCKLYINFCA